MDDNDLTEGLKETFSNVRERLTQRIMQLGHAVTWCENHDIPMQALPSRPTIQGCKDWLEALEYCQEDGDLRPGLNDEITRVMNRVLR